MMFTAKDKSNPEKHVALYVYHDGSGGVSIYQNGRLRSMVSLTWKEWQILSEALTQHLSIVKDRIE